MRKLTIVLTLILVVAFAMPVFANPFRDVPADHWAYDAISKLAADGIIAGNPDGTFTGKKNITRYEMAVLVAKAVAAAEAQADKVAAEDAALIQKLAAEFSTELATLGLRVDGLEEKVGNVKFTGDARVRYVDDKNEGTKADGRVRLTATGMINDRFTVVTRLTTGDYSFKDDGANETNIQFDRVAVNYDGKLVDISGGRLGVTLGKATLVDDKVVNGVTVAAPIGQAKLTGIYGEMDKTADNKLTAVQLDGVKLFDKATLGAAYGKLDTVNQTNTDKTQAFSIYGDYAINNNVSLFGEFAKTNEEDLNKAYYVGTAVKNVLPKSDLAVSYAKVEKNATFNGNTIHTLADNAANVKNNEIVKVEFDYALASNTNLYADYTTAKAKYADTTPNKTIHNVEAGLEFKF